MLFKINWALRRTSNHQTLAIAQFVRRNGLKLFLFGQTGLYGVLVTFAIDFASFVELRSINRVSALVQKAISELVGVPCSVQLVENWPG